NIFVVGNGPIKVLDFGIAALLRERPAGGRREGTVPVLPRSAPGVTGALTGPSAISAAVEGTLPYVAPEILLGEPAERGADLWALGVIMFEMLMGRHPVQPRPSDEALMP